MTGAMLMWLFTQWVIISGAMLMWLLTQQVIMSGAMLMWLLTQWVIISGAMLMYTSNNCKASVSKITWSVYGEQRAKTKLENGVIYFLPDSVKLWYLVSFGWIISCGSCSELLNDAKEEKKYTNDCFLINRQVIWYIFNWVSTVFNFIYYSFEPNFWHENYWHIDLFNPLFTSILSFLLFSGQHIHPLPC